MNGDGSILADVRFKGLLTADTLPFPLTDNRTVVDASREIVEHLSHLAELLSQSAQRHVSQVKTRKDTHAVHLFSGLLTYSPNLLHLQLCDEVQSPVWVNHRQSVGFSPIGSNLCQELAVAHACRCRQSRRLTDALLDFSRNIHAQLNSLLILRHIKKGFVEGYRLYQVGIVVEYLVQPCRHLLILLEMRLHDDELRTQPLGNLNGLCRMHAKPPYTTPRSASCPTAIGLPRSSGWSRCSTAAKN